MRGSLHKKELQLLIRKHKYFQTRFFRIKVAKNQSLQIRVGFAISRKFGPAVVRNRIKRKTRAFFQMQRESLCGFDFLVIAKTHLGTLNQITWLEECEKLKTLCHETQLARHCAH